MPPVKLLIVGPNGDLGRALIRRAAADPGIDLIAGVGPKDRDYTGVDLGLLVGLGRRIGARVFDSLEPIIEECDVVLEATTPEVSMTALRACVAHEKAFVTGTTGFSEAQAAEIERAGEGTAVLRASNGSPIVHLLYDLIRIVSREVGEDADIDIVEMHSRGKRDAPSGTALEMGQIIADALGQDVKAIGEYGRQGLGTRASESIQFSALRSGGAPSTHQVIFGFPNERLELTHRAYSTDAFSDGLIQAALFLSGKQDGFFTLDDVL